MAAGRQSWRFLPMDGRSRFSRAARQGFSGCMCASSDRTRRHSYPTAKPPRDQSSHRTAGGSRSLWGCLVIATSRPELRKYSLDSGLTQTISPVVDYFGGLWLDDGTIVFVNQQPAGLWSVNSAGGEPRQLAAKWILDGQEVERAVAWPSLVPGTRSVVLTRMGGLAGRSSRRGRHGHPPPGEARDRGHRRSGVAERLSRLREPERGVDGCSLRRRQPPHVRNAGRADAGDCPGA